MPTHRLASELAPDGSARTAATHASFTSPGAERHLNNCETKTHDSTNDARKVVDDIAHKWRLYMGHCNRVVDQQRAIEAHVYERAQCVRGEKGDRALVTIDCKIKVRGSGSWPRAAGTNCRPMSSDETAQEHFGIRGISWIANKISKIATAAGLGFALALSGGIQNSAVQLDSLDTSRLEALQELLALFVKKLKKSTNEISSFNSNTKSWPFKDESVRPSDRLIVGPGLDDSAHF